MSTRSSDLSVWGRQNGAKPSPPDWVSKLYRGMKSQISVKNGGSKFPSLGWMCIRSRLVPSKKWSPRILNNIDLSSYTRFGIWDGDFMLRSPPTFWWTICQKLKILKISKTDLGSFRKCQRVTKELFKAPGIVFGWFYGSLKFWKNMDFWWCRHFIDDIHLRHLIQDTQKI